MSKTITFTEEELILVIQAVDIRFSHNTHAVQVESFPYIKEGYINRDNIYRDILNKLKD